MSLYFFIAALAKIKFGSKNSFDDLIVLIDLKANIAIGSSVQPKIIFLHFFLIRKSIAGLIILLAFFTFPFFTSLIA